MEKFAFIIHPIEMNDIYRKYKYLKLLPDRMIESITTMLKPSIVSKITNVKGAGSQAEGYFIGLPLTSKSIMELPEEKVINKIIEAGKLAEKYGAKIIGLGAFTSVVGDAGITVANNLKIAVTTGNTYTVAAAYDATKEALNLLGKKIEDSHVAILGATGSIGKVCAELACREASRVTLIAREPNKLQELKESLNNRFLQKTIEVSISVEEGIKDADAVITVTSSINDIVEPEFIKTGAVICDVARPRDVSKEVQQKRKDVLVIEGGVIQVPEGTSFNFNFGFPPELSYACMAETMILALEGMYENYSIGRVIDIHKVDEIRRLANKHGFKLAGLRSFERVINAEYVGSVMDAIEKRLHVSQN
ncbi:NAD(P)H-binding protein [Alkaliphilus pronyensis]|uniref:NAD(P)H-binding protein n=1 Tax=Alkaliphilus pronyensis TaxID=1482732 RepID=A0A6I0F5B3_9FIRM|nr:NAD(P)H-binding protein [Alkaliphilus pronyensis]KAB3531276.1 NAD(P)H-binding protein [Alkaliphilus pronyensis]